MFQVEKMLELNGLQYFSTPRPLSSKGYAYGGAAIIVNIRKFQCKVISVPNPRELEVVWGLLKPQKNTEYKEILLCSFYSPLLKEKIQC